MIKKFDSSVGFTSAFEQTITRLNASASNANQIAAAQLGNPGETIDDFLNNTYGPRTSTFEALLTGTYDDYAYVVFDTNDLNVYPIAYVQQRMRDFCAYLKSKGIKGIVWQQVGACKSPYAYARDPNYQKIGTTIAEQQAGFDAARLQINETFLPSLVQDGTINAYANLQGYAKWYPQSQATDTLYYQPAGVGQYGSSEPGNVHNTQYGTKYPAEAGAQASAPMLGITLSPATIAIPDATPPASTDPRIVLPFGEIAWADTQNTTTAGNRSYKSGGVNGQWDASNHTTFAIPRPPVGQRIVVYAPNPARSTKGAALMVAQKTNTHEGIAASILGWYWDRQQTDVWRLGAHISDQVLYQNDSGGDLSIEFLHDSIEVRRTDVPIKSISGTDVNYPYYVACYFEHLEGQPDNSGVVLSASDVVAVVVQDKNQ